MPPKEPSPSWRDDPGVAAWSALLRAHAAVVRRIDHDLATTAGIPLAWYDVLLELSAAPERRLRMTELGERAVLSRTRVSRIVDELVLAGYVHRATNPDDRRSSYAQITTAGRAVFRRAAPRYLGLVRQHFSDDLTPQQLRTVRRAMEIVVSRHASDVSSDSAQNPPG